MEEYKTELAHSTMHAYYGSYEIEVDSKPYTNKCDAPMLVNSGMAKTISGYRQQRVQH